MSTPIVDMLRQLIWRPVISPGAIAALAVALAMLAVAAYAGSVRERPVRGLAFLMMRLAAIGTLALLLMRPSVLDRSANAPERARLTVMLDTSASMLTADADRQTRLGYVLDRWLTPEQVRQLGERFDLELLGFDDSARVLGTATLRNHPNTLATGRDSRYQRCLSDVLLRQSPTTRGTGESALLVIGDGHDTEDASLDPVIALAQRRGVPVHTLAIGGTQVGRDVSVVALPKQDYVMLGQAGQIIVELYQAGLGGANVTVHVTGPGVQTERHVEFGGREKVRIELPIKPEKPGLAEYHVWADPVAGESVTTNNRQSVFVDVSPRPLRVLVLEGEPNWDTKFLAQSLRSDPRVQVASISQVKPNKQQQIVTWDRKGELTVPQTAAQFAAYDVVVLGRGMEHVLNEASAKALESWVSDGGGRLVFARGRAYDPDVPAGRAMGEQLAGLEPVVWRVGTIAGDNVPLRPTAEGDASPVFSFGGLPDDPQRFLPTLPGMIQLEPVKLKSATVVLARGQITQASDAEQPPAIVSMNDGRGRVVAVLGEGLWRWAMLPPQFKAYRGVFESFWSNMVRWLAMGGEFEPGEQVSLRLGRTSVRLGDPTLLDVVTRFAPPPGFAPTLTIIDPDGHPKKLTPQAIPGAPLRRQADFTPSKAGVWRVVLNAKPLSPTTQERRFNVYDAEVERLRTDARPGVLHELSQKTGGVSFNAANPLDLASELYRQEQAQRVPPRPHDAWDRGIFLATLLGWMGIEWIGRRRAGWV